MTDNSNNNNNDGVEGAADVAARIEAVLAAAETKDAAEDATEAAMIARILGNLGLGQSPLEEQLADESIATVLATWSPTGDAALAGHRGTAVEDERTIPVEQNAVLDGLFTTPLVGQLAATVTVTTPEPGAARIVLSIGMPDEPQYAVIAEIDVHGRSTPMRFPLRLVNNGSADFPLLELAGAATVLDRDLADTRQIASLRLSEATAEGDSQ